MPDLAELMAAYDAQLRAHVSDRLPRGVTVERDGPLLRFFGLGDRGFVTYRDLGGLENADLDALISRQVHTFAERGERFEWKLHGHDLPADLPQRLCAARFVPEAEETVLIAQVTEVAGRPQLPEGVALRDASGRRDLDRIAALERRRLGRRPSWLADISRPSARPTRTGSRSSSRRPPARRLRRLGAVRAGTDSPRCGAARRSLPGAGGGSTERPSHIGRTWPPSAASATSRSTPPAPAGRSSSVSASPR